MGTDRTNQTNRTNKTLSRPHSPFVLICLIRVNLGQCFLTVLGLAIVGCFAEYSAHKTSSILSTSSISFPGGWEVNFKHHSQSQGAPGSRRQGDLTLSPSYKTL